MEDHLTRLEEKISRVAAMCESLRANNGELQTQLADAKKTRDDYGRKLDAARTRLESVLTKLPE